MSFFRTILASVALLALGGACVSTDLDPDSAPTSTNPVVQGVLAEIAADTSCISLQTTFDRGDATQDRGFRLNGENIGMKYMDAADDRMEKIGCYSK